MKKAMTEEQIRQYRAMAEPQRKLVDEGFATVVVSLEDQSTVCEYNMPSDRKFSFPDEVLEGIAESLYPEMVAFFSNPENRAKVDELLRKEREIKQKKSGT